MSLQEGRTSHHRAQLVAALQFVPREKLLDRHLSSAFPLQAHDSYSTLPASYYETMLLGLHDLAGTPLSRHDLSLPNSEHLSFAPTHRGEGSWPWHQATDSIPNPLGGL